VSVQKFKGQFKVENQQEGMDDYEAMSPDKTWSNNAR